MARRTRLAAVLTLAMINVFTLAAGITVVRMLPPRLAALKVPTVAAKPVSQAGPVLAPANRNGTLPTTNGLRSALAGPLSAAALGPQVSAAVADPASGTMLWSQDPDRLATPASTTKLVTSAAALAALGPDATFTTRVVRGATSSSVILVGGGDPTLAVHPFPPGQYPRPATLAGLAKAAARALRAQGQGTVSLGYDDLYTGPGLAPGWPAAYVSTGNVTPISALEVDQGRLTTAGEPEDSDDPYNLRARTTDPAGLAAQSFATLLRADGIHVTGTPAGQQARHDAKTLASTQSPPLSAIVQQMLQESNNVIAENLARQVAISSHQPASYSGAVTAVTDELKDLGVSPSGLHLVDGSGLSPQDKIAPAALVKVLQLATGTPDVRPLLAGLPVAGFSGTLSAGQSVFAGIGGAALGAVRAKTGNLDTVTTLAGLATDKTGKTLIFAFMADKIPAAAMLTTAAKAINEAAAALANCGCRLRALAAARTVGL